MSYKPVFKGPVEGWVVNQLKTNYWKVERTLSHMEVLQEAYVVFLRCCKHFPSSPAYDTPEAFMALFKKAWSNTFIDLSNYDTKHRGHDMSGILPSLNRRWDQRGDQHEDQDRNSEASVVGSLDNDGMLAIMISEAPAEVQTVLALFLNAPSELLESAMGSWKRRGRNSSGGSKHIAQMLGMDPKIDPMKLVADYFDHGAV